MLIGSVKNSTPFPISVSSAPSRETPPTIPTAKEQMLRDSLSPLLSKINLDGIRQFIAKKPPTNETFATQLQEETAIVEKKLLEFENAQKGQDVLDAAEALKTGIFNYVDHTKYLVRDGIDFLDNVLPPAIRERYFTPFLEEFGTLGQSSVIFLSVLDFGTRGIAAIYKGKILNQTRQLLDKIKQDTPALSVQDLKKLKQWEVSLKLAEKAFEEEKVGLGIGGTFSVLLISNLTLSQIPKTLFAAAGSVMSGISWTISVLWVAVLGLHVKEAKEKSQQLSDWSEAFQKWQKQHQPSFEEAKIGQETFIRLRVDQPQRLPQPFVSDEEHAQAFFELINKAENLEQVRDQLKGFGIELNASLTTKEDLLAHAMTDLTLIDSYIGFQRTLEKLDTTIRLSRDLLEKRKTIVQKKILLLKPRFQALAPTIKELHRTLFQNKAKFEEWYANQTPETLLQTYIDHQETLEHTTKNALQEMIVHKHEIEERFLDFKVAKFSIHFNWNLVALIASVALAIIGATTIPFGGVGLILLLLSIGSFTVTTGLIGAEFYQAYREKPTTTNLLFQGIQAKMLWANLNQAVYKYQHLAKEKRLVECVHHLLTLPADIKSVDYQNALIKLKQSEIDFLKSQQQVEAWSQHAKQLDDKLNQAKWQDFARQAHLQLSQATETNAHSAAHFDTLRAFQEAFQSCDLQMLSAETKALLEVELGLDLEALKSQLKQDPEAIKKALQKFFNLDDGGLLSFIDYQKASIEEKLIEPLPQ
jgi:hypothetical protein